MSIQYNVSMLLKEPVGSTREYEVDSRVLVDDEKPRHQWLAGRLTLLRTKQGVLVIASLQGVQSERCSRCLQALNLRLQVDIEEEFLVRADETPEEPEAFRIDERNTLDLEEAVRQYWTAALPVQPLCRSDCRGLCHRCGQNLNLAACSCPAEEDERWSALRALVKHPEGS